jgi:hypothetical protein
MNVWHRKKHPYNILQDSREFYQIWKVKKGESLVGHRLSKLHSRVSQSLNPTAISKNEYLLILFLLIYLLVRTIN